jgi:DNA-binding transcriptional regulator YiaG
VERNSSDRMQDFSFSSSQHAALLARFRQQMADYARAETFKRLRDERHLSQEEAAHELGVSVKTVRSWEHGGGIKWPNAKRVGEFYGVEPETLVDRELGVDSDLLTDIDTKVTEILELLSSLDARLRAADIARRGDEDPALSRAGRRGAEGR